MAPLAPVIAIATLRPDVLADVSPLAPAAAVLSDIDGSCSGHEIENADISIQVESAFDLTQIVLADQRLLVDEEQRHPGHAGEIDGAEIRDRRKACEANDGDHVHETRDEQRPGDPEPHWNRSQPMCAVEFEVLACVKHIESANPGADRQA